MNKLLYRTESERTFFDDVCESGRSSMSSRDWWETSGGKSRFIRRLGLIRATTAQRQSRPRVLLIGAGNGSWYQNLAEFCELKAIDISPKMVSSLRDRLPEQQRIDVELGDIHAMRFPDKCFDIVVSNSTLHHLDLEIALQEIARVLVDEGMLLAFEPNRTNPAVSRMHWTSELRRRFDLTPYEEAFGKRKITRHLRRHFLDVTVRNFDFWHPSLGCSEKRPLLYQVLLRLELVPLIRALSGSLWIAARRPAASD